MNKFCEQLGLTPSSRSRIIIDSNENEDDKMELLLFKGGGKNV